MIVIGRLTVASIWAADCIAEIILPFKIHGYKFIVEIIPFTDLSFAVLDPFRITLDIIV